MTEAAPAPAIVHTCVPKQNAMCGDLTEVSMRGVYTDLTPRNGMHTAGHAPLEEGEAPVPTRFSFTQHQDGVIRDAMQQTLYHLHEACTPVGVDPTYCVCAN